MDAAALFAPGVQSLIGTILQEGWTQARGVLARLWSEKGSISQESAEAQLEKGYELSQHLPSGIGDERALLETHWTAYLGALSAVHTDLREAIAELAAAQKPAPSSTTVHNSNTGTVRTLTQLHDVHGDLTINGR